MRLTSPFAKFFALCAVVYLAFNAINGFFELDEWRRAFDDIKYSNMFLSVMTQLATATRYMIDAIFLFASAVMIEFLHRISRRLGAEPPPPAPRPAADGPGLRLRHRLRRAHPRA